MHGIALGAHDSQVQNASGTAPVVPTRPMIAVAPDNDEDALLVRRAQRGEMDAFGLLVTRHEARVHAIVARVLGGIQSAADDVDDTVQDVFLQAWRALPRFRKEARFATWLYRIATNTAIKQWHGRKRRAQTVLESEMSDAARLALTDPSTPPAKEVEIRARDQALRTAIDALPEKHRTVVLLHYFEDYSCDDIAQMVGCSVGTVWSRLHYACRKLRGKLDWLEQN